MTTLFSTTMTAHQAPAIPRGRVALGALWLTQIALAGDVPVRRRTEAGRRARNGRVVRRDRHRQWFRYVTGSIESSRPWRSSCRPGRRSERSCSFRRWSARSSPICSSSAGPRCPQPCCSPDPSRSHGHAVTSSRVCVEVALTPSVPGIDDHSSEAHRCRWVLTVSRRRSTRTVAR